VSLKPWKWYRVYEVDRSKWLAPCWDLNVDHLPNPEFLNARASLSVLKPFHFPIRCVAKLCGHWPNKLFWRPFDWYEYKKHRCATCNKKIRSAMDERLVQDRGWFCEKCFAVLEDREPNHD